MKSKIQLPFMVCVLAVMSLNVPASVFESNNTPGYIKKVIMRSIIDGGGCGYYSNFTCEHYLNYGQSMAYTDFIMGSGECTFHYYYWADSITWIPITPPPYTISSTTAKAPVSQRTRIGVGEVVTVTLSPAPSSTNWITSGGGSLSGAIAAQVTYTAPATASNVTVTATVDGYNYVLTFEVVAPLNVNMERNASFGVYHEFGRPSAGMKTDIYILPNDVNFSAIEFQEGSCFSTANGYWAPLNGEWHLVGSWLGINSHVAGKGSTNILVQDTISQTGDPGWSLASGTYSWPIPWYYRIKGDTGAGYFFGNITHYATATATGSVTVSKAFASYTAALNDPYGSWWP